MKVNGCQDAERAKEFKFGQMDQNIADSGEITRPMEQELFITQMVMSMKGNGKTIKLVGKELTHIKMEQNILDSGDKISKMVLEWRCGLMVKNTKDSIKTVPKMEKEFSNSLTKATMKENFA